MRKMNCRSVRREIEEAPLGNLLSASASDHLRDCPQCSLFREDRLKLREILASLGSVEAPGDFDFRLRARLANERRPGTQPFVMRNFSFGFRSAAATAMLLLVGAALLFVNFRTPPGKSLSANEANPPASGAPQPASPINSDTVAGVTPVLEPLGIKETSIPQKSVISRNTDIRSQPASVRGKTETSRGLATLEQSSTGAKVLRPGNGTAVSGSRVFPIEASYQSLKVSLDDGRGASRTIALPSVSFGSQRVLTQSSSPLLASARSDW